MGGGGTNKEYYGIFRSGLCLHQWHSSFTSYINLKQPSIEYFHITSRRPCWKSEIELHFHENSSFCFSMQICCWSPHERKHYIDLLACTFCFPISDHVMFSREFPFLFFHRLQVEYIQVHVSNYCTCITLVTRALDQSKAMGNSTQENMRRRVLMAKNWLFEPYGACSLLVLT